MGALLSPRLVLGAAVAIAVVAVLGAAAWWLYDAGGDAREADGLRDTINTQRSITDADARGPRTPDAVDQRLRDGKF